MSKNQIQTNIYFIDSHLKTQRVKIYLPEEYRSKVFFKIIHKEEINNELSLFSSTVYKLIIPADSLKEKEGKYQITILGKILKTHYQYTIEFPVDAKYFFVYDFNVMNIDFQPLTEEEQFEMYAKAINKLEDKDPQEIESLINSTHKLLDKEGKKYSFYFYLLIFMECYKTKLIKQHLLKFNPEKLKGLGTFPEAKMEQFKNILNALAEGKEILNLTEEGEEKKEDEEKKEAEEKKKRKKYKNYMNYFIQSYYILT